MDFDGFDLNLLRVLDALLQEGSTVKAAEKLNISQPAVSSALGRLRYALEDELFIRQGPKLVPTARAEGIAIPLREELARIESLLIAHTAFDPARAELNFRIAGADFFADVLIPPLAAAIASVAPGIRIQMLELVRDNPVDSLEQFRADIALHPDQSIPDWVMRATLMSADFVLIAALDNPHLAEAGLSPGDEVPLDLFCSLGHVIFSPEGNITAPCDAALSRIGRKRRVAMTMPFFSGICRVVSESDLVALIPFPLAEKLAPQIGFALYKAPLPVPSPMLVATWHKRNDANPVHRWLRGEILRIVAPFAHSKHPLVAR